MEQTTSLQQQLLEAGVHFGHLKKKWNPKMLPYIFAEKKGIHIIDLNKTTESLQEAAAALKQIAKSGKKIMFVATKKQSKESIAAGRNVRAIALVAGEFPAIMAWKILRLLF